MRLAETIGTREIRRGAATHLSHASKIFPWTTRLWNLPRARASAARVSVLPAKVGWSDIGSWNAVYELLATETRRKRFRRPILRARRQRKLSLEPGKFVAAIGVHDLVLVETDDAILLCPRDRAQDVGKIVK